jgi:hypothetical protein
MEEEGFDLPVRGGGEPGEEIGEILEAVDIVPFCRTYYGIDHSSTLSGVVRTFEHIVIASDGDRPDAVFNKAVAELYIAVIEEWLEMGPLSKGIADSFAYRTFRKRIHGAFFKPYLKLFHGWSDKFLPSGEALCSVQVRCTGVFFYLVPGADDGKGVFGIIGLRVPGTLEIAAHMIHAGCAGNTRLGADSIICLIPVNLQDAFKSRKERFRYIAAPAFVVHEHDHFSQRIVKDPIISPMRFPFAIFTQNRNRSFVGLQIPASFNMIDIPR